MIASLDPQAIGSATLAVEKAVNEEEGRAKARAHGRHSLGSGWQLWV
jgi:hypothetical protein